MGLNKQNGNMYDFVEKKFNPLGGKCSHECVYCYMKNMMRFPVNRKKYSGDLRLVPGWSDQRLGSGKLVFVCSANDLFAEAVPSEFIRRVLQHCFCFDNTYLFQSKNPKRFTRFTFPKKTILGTTIESNRDHHVVWNNALITEEPLSRAPHVRERAEALHVMSGYGYRTMVTIEPICDFDLDELVDLIRTAKPDWVNIGADSKKSNLPEPSGDKVRELIDALSFVEIKTKKNLRRLKSG